MAVLTLTYPTNLELTQVIQEYQIDAAGFKGAEILPDEETMSQRVQWDEMDNERGMTAAHVMGTDPKIDLRPGSKVREYTPIAFKETDLVKEDEILRSRELGTLGNVVSLSGIIARIAKARKDKTWIRKETLRWDTLRGRIQLNENGVFVDETFPVQQYQSTIAWSNLTTATPLRDFNAVKLLFRGTGATIAGAKAYINQTTANWILENQNPNDLKGFQNSNFVQLPYSIEEANKVLSSRGLPTLEIYDDGYFDINGVFQTFIKDGDVHIVGKRPAGQKVGGWMSTASLHRNVNGMPAPGYFSIIEVNGQPSTGATTISTANLGASKNPKFDITGGEYGGTIMRFGRSVIRMRTVI